MTIVQSIVLGAIQGLTEFLPVSSSGHLIFVPALLGWTDQGTGFDAVVNVGTLLAVVVYFRQELWRIASAIFSSDTAKSLDRRLAWYLLLSTIPAAVVGLLINDIVRSPLVIGINFIMWGIVLGLADWYYKRLKQTQPTVLKQVEDVRLRDVVIMSCAQAIALLPGTSRSGITMTAGLFSKLDKSAAATFSFLMSVPIIALACADQIFKLYRHGLGDLTWSVMAAGVAASAVCGFLAIDVLLKIVKRWSFFPFVVYRVVLGIILLVVFSS